MAKKYAFSPWPHLPKFFALRAIPGAPWSYSEHVKAIVAAVAELKVNKQTDIHTKRIIVLYIATYKRM